MEQPNSTGQLCCRTCIVAGDLLGTTGTADPDDFDVRGDTLIAESRRIEFRRGFVDTVSCTMEEVVRGGVVTEWAKAVVRAFPISEFIVTDRVPFVWLDGMVDFISNRTILRYRGMTPGWAMATNYERSTIPDCVADLMDGPYKTHQEATAAFRKTLVNLVRSQS
jgi:hypothetical protein